MFGIWRTMLAIEVAASHILLVPILGGYAVFSFFVLSGYLMTAIMHGTYGYARSGLWRYAENRALRLYPSYWFALAVSLLVIRYVGDDVATRHFAAFTLPRSATEWVQNVTMIFPYIVPSDARSILAPPTWALTVEIFYYGLIGVGLSRTRQTCWLWFSASIGYIVMVQAVAPENRWSYAAVPAGSLAFSVGALTWHYRDALRLSLAVSGHIGLAALVAVRWLVVLVSVLILWRTGWPRTTMVALWVNIPLSAAIIAQLSAIEISPRLRHFDKAVGDFSYPLYLLHMQIGVLVTVLLFGTRFPRLRSFEGVAVLTVTLIVTGLVALVCVRIIDPAVERRRIQIRARALSAVA